MNKTKHTNREEEQDEIYTVVVNLDEVVEGLRSNTDDNDEMVGISMDRSEQISRGELVVGSGDVDPDHDEMVRPEQLLQEELDKSTLEDIKQMDISKHDEDEMGLHDYDAHQIIAQNIRDSIIISEDKQINVGVVGQ